MGMVNSLNLYNWLSEPAAYSLLKIARSSFFYFFIHLLGPKTSQWRVVKIETEVTEPQKDPYPPIATMLCRMDIQPVERAGFF